MTTERQTHPNSSHISFPYFFSNAGIEDGSTTNRIGGINFGDIPVEVIPQPYFLTKNDLMIYYDSLTGNDRIDCACSRWTVDNYSVVIETWLKKNDLQTLLANITPGGVKEMYSILGLPKYYDTTWTGKNTIKIVPNISSSSNLPYMRKEVIIYPKNITIGTLDGEKGHKLLKLEGFVSGTTEL